MTKPKAKRPEQIGIMKAKPTTERLLAALGPQCFAQPKLRGQRCRTVWLDDEPLPLLLSSYGNAFMFMDHIREELSHFPHLPFDGELYVHDPAWDQQKINSVCNRTVNPHAESAQVGYFIFDLALVDGQHDRLYKLFDECYCTATRTAHIHLVETKVIDTKEWIPRCEHYCAEGYEGIILRALEGRYSPIALTDPAQRPSTMLKFKPTEFDEYDIIDYAEGTGWATGMLGSFVVRSPEGGASFSVGTGPELTKAKRQYYWAIRERLLGAVLVVKHEKNVSTQDGIPICTVAYKVCLK